MIEVKDIHSYYGKSHILHGVSLELKEGELVCLLGRNGVGKSTTLKSIMGIVRPTHGSIRFDGKELVGSQPYQIARLGVGYVPEDRRIFKSLTVHENLLMGTQKAKNSGAAERAWTIDKDIRHLSQPEGASQQQRQPPVGRRTADAHGGTDPHGEPEAHPRR